MPNQNSRGAGAQRAGGLDELKLARPQHLPAHQPRVAHPANHRQRQHDIGETRSENSDERDRQKNSWKGQQHVDAAADRIIDPSAEVACKGAKEHANDGRNADDRNAHEQRNSGAGQHPRKNVAPQLVEPEGMMHTRTFQSQRQLLA